jgi:hypothetical protein
MGQKPILFITIFILMICSGCKKSSTTPSTDYASNAAGLYSGTFVVAGIGQVPGTCEVIKVSNTSVNLKVTAGGQPSTSPGINLSDGGNGKINLSYSDSNGTITGTVENKSLTLTIVSAGTQMTFSGTKP